MLYYTIYIYNDNTNNVNYFRNDYNNNNKSINACSSKNGIYNHNGNAIRGDQIKLELSKQKTLRLKMRSQRQMLQTVVNINGLNTKDLNPMQIIEHIFKM